MSEERRKNGEKEPDIQEMRDFDVRGGKDLPWWKEIARILRRNTKSLVIVVFAAVALLGAGILLGAMIGERSMTGQTARETQTEETVTQTAEAGAAYAPLEENAYPEVNALIESYYQAAASGDIDTINAIKDYSSETELLQIREKSRYLEGYEDINCYTKPGPIEGSFVVYASYYAKFRDIDRTVCGLNTFVVCRDENGAYYIHDCTNDETMREYRINVTKQDDVVELFNRVQVEYNEAVTEDAELAAFLTQLSEDLKASVGDALAGLETENGEEAAGGQQTEEAGQEENAQDGNAAEGTLVEATDVVNIRSSDSEEADVLGKAQTGDTFTLLESRENGWSRVEYEGGEAFIKSEYLAALEEPSGEEASEEPAPEEAGQQEPEGEDAAEVSDGDDSSAEEVSGGADVPDSGTYRLTTTVNIRSGASEDAGRIGVGYSGDEVEILMKQADGWTRVRFKGEEGYIRTDVLR